MIYHNFILIILGAVGANCMLLNSASCLPISRANCISLNGEWTGHILSRNLSFPAVVPGGVYTDLLKAKVIPENFFGFNDVNNRWVAYESVNYVKYFTVNTDLLEHERLTLMFYGLDTFATISINDKQIGNTSNMFTRYYFSIKDYLKPGQNKLNVSFESPVKKSDESYEEQSQIYIIPPECVPNTYNGECHVNHIRKMQASYSWDWGPAFPSMGIWKDVEIIPTKHATVSDIVVNVVEQSSTWLVNISVYFIRHDDIIPDNKFYPFLSSALVSDDNNVISYNQTSEEAVIIKDSEAVATLTLEVSKNAVERWWPNGHGQQNLYFMNFQVAFWEYRVEKHYYIGFRTVELVQEPVPKGLSFYFRVNGVPIFAKGSNWIPSSIFPELSSHENTIEHLLSSARAAHMNMLRVWGGGFYESDRFYELADEYGIMIWQDFMFACSMYPANDQFLNLVKEEITQNTRRLMYHPSIVLWAGNNENEAALWGDWYGTGSDQVYKDDYIKLYVDVIKNLMKELDPTRPFVVSSPSNGLFDETNGHFGLNPQSRFYGDVHYYNYIKNGWDINQYPTARFSSEYGLQSLPFLETLMKVAPKLEDLNVSSEFMKHRQHLPVGDTFLRKSIEQNFDTYTADNKTINFESYIFLSQINQAVSIQIETEHYRQMMSSFNDKGEGKTMGALYWQLNDVWQAPSWSSIDFEGRWKMLHYHAVKFFSPVIISPRLSLPRDLKIYVISDRSDTIKNAKVGIKIYNWNSTDPVFVKYYSNITVASKESNVVIPSFWLDEFLVQNTNCGNLETAKRNCLVELELRNERNVLLAPLNYVYPSDFKHMNHPQEFLYIRMRQIAEMKYQISITSKTISLFMWLDFENIEGRFSENGFHKTIKHKKVIFTSKTPTSEGLLLKNLRVRTLNDVYSPLRKLIFL